MKVLIAAGGTGGHIFPGIALARELVERGTVPLFDFKRRDSKINFGDKNSAQKLSAYSVPRNFGGLAKCLMWAWWAHKDSNLGPAD